MFRTLATERRIMMRESSVLTTPMILFFILFFFWCHFMCYGVLSDPIFLDSVPF